MRRLGNQNTGDYSWHCLDAEFRIKVKVVDGYVVMASDWRGFKDDGIPQAWFSGTGDSMRP